MSEATCAVVDQESSAWVVAHQALSRLAKERAAADSEEGRWLLAALRSAAHVHLGFGTFGEYIERWFGYKPRSTHEKLRVAEALEGLPVLGRALEEGTLHWSAAREITRVAVADTEREWLEAARGKSVRQLEELVAGKRPGDDPSGPHPPCARRHVLRFEVAPETLALFREAMTALRRSTASMLDDDSALLAMARHVLGGSRDEGRASYQIAVTVCEECGCGHQLSSGEPVPVGPDMVAMAHCDGQQLGRIAAPAANENAVPSAAEKSESAHVGTHVLGLDGSARTNDAALSTSVRARATQTIPPALRRAVLLRDQRRCRVPGCRNTTFLDLHHLQLRSEGGRNEAENLLTLCGAHHRAAHRGELWIEGSAAAAARFRHADGSAYGRAVEPQSLDVQAKTFAALRGLGFREAEVRAVLAQLRDESDLRAATTEQWLRAALARLTRPRL